MFELSQPSQPFCSTRSARLAAIAAAMLKFVVVIVLGIAFFVGILAAVEQGTQPPYNIDTRDTAAVRKGRFEGKVCLVTGATSGMGADAAVHLAAEGCKTVLTGRRDAMGETVVKSIQDAGGEATFVQADVTKEEDCKRMVEVAVEKYGKLDAAFNNAGILAKSTPLHEISLETFKSSMDVNVIGVFLSMKYEIPAMMKAGGGSIVNCASIYGLNGGSGFSAYATTKHALTGLTKSAAAEYGAHNIRINNVNPGFVKSEMTDEFGGSHSMIEMIGRLHPGNRWVKPEEISSGVAWLLSDDSSYTSGINLEISGGISTGFIPPSFQNEAFAKAEAEMDSSSGKSEEF